MRYLITRTHHRTGVFRLWMTKRRHLHQTVEEGHKYCHESKRVKLRFVIIPLAAEETGEAENVDHDM